MRTDLIQQHYANAYGEQVHLGTMTQALLSSGLFKRAGWYNRVHDEMIETTLSSTEMGIKDPAYVCVVEAKPLEEILATYRERKHPLRKMSKMPHFVREAIAQDGGDAQ